MRIFTDDKYSPDELKLIQFEHRKAYLNLFKSTIFVQTLFPLVLCLVFHSLVPSVQLYGWLTCIVSITLMRAYLTYGWYDISFDAKRTRLFEYLSLSFSLVAGLLWGSTVLFMDFNQYPQASVFLNIVVFGLATGSVGIGSYLFEYFLIFNLSVFSFYIGAYLLGIPEPYYLLAVSLGLFLAFMIQIVLAFHRSNAQNIWLSKRNEKLASSLEVKKQEAEHSAASRTRLLASASHDLRQPLQALNFFLAALQPEIRTDKGKNLYAKLDQCTEGMNELLGSILDISKLDAQTVTLSQEAFCLNSMLDALDQQFRIAAENKGLSLTVASASVYVYSDPILVRRILSNLIANAVNYTEKGSIEVAIVQGQTLELQVRDTGLGLTEQEQTHIFEEFYQLNNPERDRKKGLGLGLSIVKRLCQLMDIPLSVASVKGEGSSFSLQLPICEAPPVSAAPQSFSPENLTEDKKVLVIDDEISIRESLAELLRKWQCEVETAESAQAAVELIEARQFYPDLIIADYRLREGKTGVEAIQTLKAALGQAHLPAIIISGDTEPKRLQEVSASGYELLHKPVKPVHLRMLVQQKLM